MAIPDASPPAAPTSGPNNLYRTLHALRQTLDAGLGPGAADAAFSFDDGVLALGESVWVDVHEFERLAQAPNQQSAISNLQSAIALHAGDLLPDDLYADWTSARRESLRRLHRQASLTLAAHHRDAGEYDQAIARLVPLVERDKADEPVHRELMRVYALAGRRHEALRQYKACVEALAAELDVPPDPETTALYSQILAGELGPASAIGARAGRRGGPPTVSLAVAREARASAQLVGREAEFSALLDWMRAIRQGKGKTVLIGGEAGIGKTLLASEALCAGAGEGMTALYGAAYEQEGQLPYQPFVEALDRHLAGGAGENPITDFKRRSNDPQQDQWAMFNAAADFLTVLARRAPVVLLVDDLHAADEASLRLFHYLARRTRTAPVLLLATYRADAPQTATPFGALANALYRERLGEWLDLSPLTPEAVAGMVAHVLGGPPATGLVAAVHEVAEGNPLFVREIVESLRQRRQVEQRDGAWRLSTDGAPGAWPRVPSGLGGLLREQVRRLGPQVESALTAASVLGRDFDFEVLRGVATLSDGELLDSLDRALAGHLLEETSSGYRFRHALIRHALYDSLSRARRARLHCLAAARMESTYASRPGGLEPHVEDLAYHYDLGDRRDRALDYLIQAGRKAARLFAYEAAVNYHERALALMDELGLPDPERRFRLLESLGKYYKVLADISRSLAAFDRALSVGTTADGGTTPGEAPGWVPSAGDRARARRLAAMVLLTAGRLHEAESYLQAAQRDLEAEVDSPEWASVLYNAAQLHWHRNEYHRAFEVAQRSLAAAERRDDVAAMARASEMLALACHSLGEWQAGLAYEQRRAALAGPALDVTDAFDVHL